MLSLSNLHNCIVRPYRVVIVLTNSVIHLKQRLELCIKNIINTQNINSIKRLTLNQLIYNKS